MHATFKIEATTHELTRTASGNYQWVMPTETAEMVSGFDFGAAANPEPEYTAEEIGQQVAKMLRQVDFVIN